MKPIRLYITAAVLALAGIMATQAGAQVLRDADFNSIGRINGNGVVRDATGRSAGLFDDDGTVRDVKGTAVGVIKELEIFDTTGTPTAPCATARATCWAASASTTAR